MLKCSNIKLKTYIMILASTGMRATEALALRHKDFDFDDENSSNNINRQAFVRIRGEATKTSTDRYVFFDKGNGGTVQSLDENHCLLATRPFVV